MYCTRICTWFKLLVSRRQRYDVLPCEQSSRATHTPLPTTSAALTVSSVSLLRWWHDYYPSLPSSTTDGDLSTPPPTPATSLRLQALRMSVTAKLLPKCVCWFDRRDFLTSSHRNTFCRQTTISCRPVSIPFTFESAIKVHSTWKKKIQKFQEAGRIRILFYLQERKLWNCFLFNLAFCFRSQHAVFRSFHFYYGDQSFKIILTNL
jgi:hypothetical protein